MPDHAIPVTAAAINLVTRLAKEGIKLTTKCGKISNCSKNHK